MTHGAHASGVRAADWCAKRSAPGDRVIVVGAGLAGLAAAASLQESGIDCVVIEARDRLGGRVHTVDLAGRPGEPTVAVDAGAAWLQQFGRNPLAPLAVRLGATLVPTDFHAPLSAAADGETVRSADVAEMLLQLQRHSSSLTADRDVPLSDVLADWSSGTSERDRRVMQHAVDADVVLETGAGLDDTSARWFFAEDGVGNDDHLIIGGYRTIVDHLAAGLDIRLGSPVTEIRWNDTGVVLSVAGAEMRASRCICSVPVSLLQCGVPRLAPGLPSGHREALGRIGMGVVDKVILRFDQRWWPRPPHGYFRWYDTPASWCEWVDLTDGCGEPVVAGLIAHDAVGVNHSGRTDEQIAIAASSALRRWADAFNSDREAER